ncbi:hypothetical protein VB713_17150 [Anabaena cylindrica UHCC 0172]|uniref:hypothetical protein n=1 Tax=Anabaena cylindrica TaxID=1165 RepID=UPI002B21E541|nr:hypothetical protein [Anabaena cylindrica]MEA5552672.1 hypothetical protein [Anabaena cylindrica UHCC 0172]
MNIRRVLAVAAIPFVIGTFGFVAPNQASAEIPSHRHPPVAQQQRPNKKPQVKKHQPRPQQKKRLPQPHHQEIDRNQVRPNNR